MSDIDYYNIIYIIKCFDSAKYNCSTCESQSPTSDAPAASSAPAAPAVEPPDSDALPKYKRDLAAKARVLRAELQALQPQTGHCRIEVTLCCTGVPCFYNIVGEENFQKDFFFFTFNTKITSY